MSHPSASGSNSGSSTLQPQHSLPPKPPPSASSLPSRPVKIENGAPSSSHGGARPGGLASFTGFKPRTVASAAPTWQQAPAHYAAAPQSVSSYPGVQSGYQQRQSYNQQQGYAQQYYAQPQTYAASTPPSIRNPFPAPGQAGAGRGAGAEYDAEEAANLAQWQSAYISKDESKSAGRGRGEGAAAAGGANATPLANNRLGGAAMPSNIDITAATPADTGVASVVAGRDGKQKTVVRSGGGQTWQDPSLLEWDPAHFRLFIGNLAGEVTDDSLLKAFARYTSVQKAKVVRDKRTTKSKGYGFVSFSDGDDYFLAAKEMQGKYIGSHPILIKRSTTDIKISSGGDKRKNFQSKNGLGATRSNNGAGISKKPAKTKGGLKILG